jgi:MFS family permease
METFDDEHVEHAAEEASVSTNGSQQPLSESVIELTVAKAPPSSRCEDDGLASEQAQTAPENESLVVGLQDAPRDHEGAASIRANFILMSLLVSTLPASSLACLALATEQLGSIGAWQSGTLYFTYTLSAITGATYVVKSYGSRNALIIGMALFCLYVTCFFLATFGAWERPLALTGAAIGGIGAGIFWTSVGAYLSRAAEEYSLASGMNWDESTGYLAAIFAFIFLAEETTLDVLSTVLTEAGLPWILVFALYAALAILATSFMKAVKTYPVEEDTASSVTPFRDSVYKATSALYLLVKDPKMKYMLGLNCAFGLAGAFLNSFVNGEVVPVVMSEDYVGLLVAIHGGTAAIFSLIFGYLAQYTGKTPILIMGSICLGSVAYPFLWQPDLTQWTWISVGSIYVLAGIGRATFEGTLKAVFADYVSLLYRSVLDPVFDPDTLFESTGSLCTRKRVRMQISFCKMDLRLRLAGSCRFV